MSSSSTLELPDASADEICRSLPGSSRRRRSSSSRARRRGLRVAAIESGAAGYLLKDADDLDLAGAIERVFAGERVIDPRAAAALIDSRGEPGEPG